MRRGPRTKLTEETQASILEAIELGASEAGAARYAGVGPRTLSRWKAKGEIALAKKEADRTRLGRLCAGLWQALSHAHARNLVRHTGQAREACFRGTRHTRYRRDGSIKSVSESPPDWRANAWWLKTRYPEEFSETATVRHSHEHRHQIEPDEIDFEAEAERALRAAVAVLGRRRVVKIVNEVSPPLKKVGARVVKEAA